MWSINIMTEFKLQKKKHMWHTPPQYRTFSTTYSHVANNNCTWNHVQRHKPRWMWSERPCSWLWWTDVWLCQQQHRARIKPVTMLHIIFFLITYTVILSQNLISLWLQSLRITKAGIYLIYYQITLINDGTVLSFNQIFIKPFTDKIFNKHLWIRFSTNVNNSR